YYHYPAKDELVNALFNRYEAELDELLGAADAVRNVEDAWLFFHMLFELIWKHRFLYRDLNDLLFKNRRLETHFQTLIAAQERAMRHLLSGLHLGGSLKMELRDVASTANTMVVVVSYWLSYEYVRDPRRALEPERASSALLRGAFHALSLLLPYLEPASRDHLFKLAGNYQQS
ncbi:MAG: TetR family transcriptional regulator, partial [Caulobacteraceae bacterium]